MDKKNNINSDIDLTKLDGLVLDDEARIAPIEPIAIVNSAPNPEKEVLKNKSKKMLIILLSAFGFALIIVSVLVWLFQFKGIYAFQGLPLETYSNSVYSIKKPVDYEKFENSVGTSGTDITFFNPKKTDTSVQSKVYIVSNIIDDTTKEKYISQLDLTFSESVIEQSKKSASGYKGQFNIKYAKDDFNGFQARRVDYEITKSNDHVGRYSKISLFKDRKIYEIIISVSSSDPGLAVDIDKIFASFALK